MAQKKRSTKKDELKLAVDQLLKNTEQYQVLYDLLSEIKRIMYSMGSLRYELGYDRGAGQDLFAPILTLLQTQIGRGYQNWYRWNLFLDQKQEASAIAVRDLVDLIERKEYCDSIEWLLDKSHDYRNVEESSTLKKIFENRKQEILKAEVEKIEKHEASGYSIYDKLKKLREAEHAFLAEVAILQTGDTKERERLEKVIEESGRSLSNIANRGEQHK